MSATELAAIVAIVAGYASSVYFIVGRLEGRLDRIEQRLERVEDRLTVLEVTVARIGQHLDDHIVDHPGAAR